MLWESSPSRSKAFVSFDAMFSIVPALLMIALALGAAHLLTERSAERMHGQESFDKLVSIADYVVKQGAARTECVGTRLAGCENVRYPNWLESAKVDDALAEGLGQRAGLAVLSIRLDYAGPGPACVYRLVVVDDRKDIRKLYVCGG